MTKVLSNLLKIEAKSCDQTEKEKTTFRKKNFTTRKKKFQSSSNVQSMIQQPQSLSQNCKNSFLCLVLAFKFVASREVFEVFFEIERPSNCLETATGTSKKKKM